MNRKRITDQEFRFYDMPGEHPVIVLSGESWYKNYGDGIKKLHFHNILEVGICRSGEGTMVYEREEIAYRAGDISIIPRNVPHTTYNEPGVFSRWDYIFVDERSYLDRFYASDPAFARRMADHVNCRYLLVREEDHPGLRGMIDCLVCEKTQELAYTDEVVDFQAVSLLLLIARENREFDKGRAAERVEHGRKIQDVLEYIEDNYYRQLSVGEMADAASLSEPHFRRVFGSVMNMSPGNYLNMIRIQHACTLLKNTDLAVEIVAERSGFVTASTFNRNFFKYMGITPLKWKKTKSRSRESEGGIRVTAFKGWEE